MKKIALSIIITIASLHGFAQKDTIATSKLEDAIIEPEDLKWYKIAESEKADSSF
jgi:hypothetical protein